MVRLLGILVKRELVDNLTSSRYILTSVLCIVLCITSIILMSHDYENRIKRHDLSHNVGGKRNIFDWGNADIIAKQPVPLSLICKGTEEVLGRPSLPEGPIEGVIVHFYNYFGEEHHLFDLFTTPDFVYIVSVVFSIFAVFFSYSAICGEKETHTLRLLLSNSLPRWMIILAKWIGGYASFLVSLCPAILLMIIYLTVFSGVPLQMEHWMRLASLLCLSFVYLSVFFTLGVLLSTVTHRSATALVLALVIWALWALGTPSFGISVAQAIKPTKPETIFRREKYPVISRWGMLTEQERDQLWRMNDAHITAMDSQIRMGQHLSRLSPLASYVYAATTLAQTGLSDYRDYRIKLWRWNRERIRTGYPGEFVYQPLTLRRSLSEAAVDGALLLLWNILLFMGANMAFLRYDVR